MFATTNPKLLVPKTASLGHAFLVQNLSATDVLLIHEERDDSSQGLQIGVSSTSAPFTWNGGELWISASPTLAEYRLLASQPARGAKSRERFTPGGAPGGGGGGGGEPPAPPAPGGDGGGDSPPLAE